MLTLPLLSRFKGAHSAPWARGESRWKKKQKTNRRISKQGETMPKRQLLGEQRENVGWDRKAGSCQAWNDCSEGIKLGCWRWSRRNTTNWQGKNQKKSKQTGKQRNRCPTWPCQKFASSAFYHCLSSFQSGYTHHPNSPLLLYVCVTGNAHGDVHRAVGKAPRKCGSALLYIF